MTLRFRAGDRPAAGSICCASQNKASQHNREKTFHMITYGNPRVKFVPDERRSSLGQAYSPWRVALTTIARIGGRRSAPPKCFFNALATASVIVGNKDGSRSVIATATGFP